MARFIAEVSVRYTVEAENREAAKRVIAGVAESTRRSGVTKRSGSGGTATMDRVAGQVIGFK